MSRNQVTIKINMTGLDEMIDALKDLQTEGVARAQRALDDALDLTAERSRALAHLDEGTLRASQSHSSTHEPDGWVGAIAYSGRGAAFEMAKGGEHAAYIDSLAHLSHDDFLAAV